jgi:hypothetical protein
MIKEQTLNNIVVKPLVSTVNNIDVSKVKGGKLIPTVYNCTFLAAKRASGKTSTLAEILLRTSDKKTQFYIFCPTTKVDTSWITLIDKLETRGNIVNVFDSMMDGKVNLLNEIMADLSTPEDSKIKVEDDEVKNLGCRIYFGDAEKKEKKEYKPKKIAPKHIFCFDDISDEIKKNPALVSLLKKSRHFSSAVYISSQYVHDLQPQSIKQLDYFFCFRSFSRDKLEHIYKLLDLSIGLEKFVSIYDYCFKDPNERFSFLYIDVRNQKFRKNFNKNLILE